MRHNRRIGETSQIKALLWVGSSRKDLKAFPAEVRSAFGFALFQAQSGHKPSSAKPLAGFRGASVLEIVDDFQTDTYRAVYTVKFGDAVYVLHAFQKKSKRGTATPKAEIDLIKRRLKLAEENYKTRRQVSE
jgi:phage-related protein